MKRASLRALVVGLFTILGGGLFWVPVAHATDDVTINLVVSNDFHGRIDDKLVQWAATVDELLRQDVPEDSLFLAAGDLVGMSVPASEEADDDPAIDALNMLGLDATAVGNHEFDKGYDDLTEHIMQRADFPILGANVENADGSPALDASAMFTVGGIRLAVIGAVTADTPNLVVNQEAIAGLSFTDPAAAINRTVDELNALPEGERPQVMVVLIHEGSNYNYWNPAAMAEDDQVFAQLINDISPDVDAIVSGHTHKLYAQQVPVPGDETGRTRPVIQTGEHGSHVGQLTLTISPDTGEVVSSTQRVVSRVTDSDEALIAERPYLEPFKQLRDDAVAYANDRIAAREATQTDYDAAVVSAEAALADVEEAQANYDAAVAERDAANEVWLAKKGEIEGLVAEGREHYTEAAELKTQYDAFIAEGQAAYGEAAAYRDEYNAALAEGRQAYADADALKQQYAALIADGQVAYGEAADLKSQYDVLLAEGVAKYGEAADLKAQYDALMAQAQQGYADVAVIRDEFFAVQATGGSESADQLASLEAAFYQRLGEANSAYAQAAALQEPYYAAFNAAQTAYGAAVALQEPYYAAMGRAQLAYTQAAELKGPFDAALATAQAKFTRLAELQAPYNAAMAAGNEAYAQAAALQPPWEAAMVAGGNAYIAAQNLMPAYEAALATLNEAVELVAELAPILQEALDVWHAALNLVDSLKVTLLGLL